MSEIVVECVTQAIEIVEEVTETDVPETVFDVVEQVEVIDFGDQILSGQIANSRMIVGGENLSAFKVIYPGADGKMFYASSDNPACKSKVWGVSTTAMLEDEAGFGASSGEISNNTWTWDTSKPIFLGINGELTQVVPTSGFLLVVARPVTATTVMVKIEIPINR